MNDLTSKKDPKPYMDSLNFILDKYDLRGQKSPVNVIISRLGSLPRLFKNLGYKVGAEIGVEQGRFSKYLASENPNLKLYCVDAWLIYDGYRDNETREHMEGFYKTARQRLAPYNCHFVRDLSMNAVKRFADESLDFVYIDAVHDYKHVKEDIREWSKKVRKGGVVSGHDYVNGYPNGFPDNPYEVIQAVNEWIKENNISPLFLTAKDQSPSWFYVKS